MGTSRLVLFPAILSLLASTALPSGDPPQDAAKRIKEFEAQASALQKKTDAEIKALRDKLIEDLQALQDSYTKAGKLDEAVFIRERIKQFKAATGYGGDYQAADNPFTWPNREIAPQIARGQITERPNKQEGVLGPKSELWDKLRKKVKENSVDKTSIHNGRWGKTPFAEVPEEGALLIGFYCDPEDWMAFVQPIFLSASGEKPGKAYGTAPEKVFVLKAKPGYAVGRMYVRSGDLFDGLGVTFYKVTPEGLDTDSAYDSEYVGQPGGSGQQAGGDGAFIVGIHGRLVSQGDLAPVGSIATLGGICVKLR